MSGQDLVKFWVSILGESVFADQLETVMDIEDSEERTFKLLCKTLFLLVMEIKHERDEIKSTGTSNGDVCRLCQDKLSRKNHSDMEEREESWDHKKQEGRPLVKARKIASKRRASPLKMILGSRKGDQGEKREDRGSEEEDSPTSPKVVVPETMSLDEHPLHVNVEKRKMLTTQTVMVPETMPLNCTPQEEDDSYNNEDFFDTVGTCKENISPENHEEDHLEEDFVYGSETPVKGTSKAPESVEEQSPVLGKQNKAAAQRARAQEDPTDISKKLDFESTPKVVLEPTTEPDSGPKNNIKTEAESASSPRYSPLVFTNTPLLMQDDSDITSPSLLPGATNKSSQNEKAQDKGSPLMAILSKKAQVPALSRAKRSLQKAASSFNLSPPREKLRRLQRHHTLDKQPKTLYEMTLEPPGPKCKKIYKQTKISAEVFQQKNKSSGMKEDEDEEDENLLAAMKESLRSKAVEDMLRKKEKALQTLEYGVPLEGDAEEREEAGVSSKEQTDTFRKCNHSPGKGKTKKISSPIKLPKLSPTKHVSSSPTKEFKSPVRLEGIMSLKRKTQDRTSSPSKIRSSPRKHVSLPTRNLPAKAPQARERKSPRKRLPQPSPEKKNRSPAKKRRVEGIKAGETGSKREQVLGLDELLEQVNTSPSSAKGQAAKSRDESPGQRKVSLRKNKREFFDNSFDVVPQKNEEPGYAYLGDVVRKRDARKQLQGWGCRECEKWYEHQDLDPEERQRLMNKCSRHRSKHNPVTNTPKHFWDPGWVDSDESTF
ncbi:serine/arginine repetitive matrix protein 1-like [Penaeus japonicus]|uniref:serine/arginine repetitive matrix protein 1-like n=1 Tax=Penaeus japonicus TaxID=27405 RepID=UPI001C70BF16|nr:serine/arginine repetitive matrix protein 1-like [Penaeus japonicus]